MTARGPVTVWRPLRAGDGARRQWSRVVGGSLVSVTQVAMPDGGVRWFVRRFNGYVGGPRFGCAWGVVGEWTFAPSAAGVRAFDEWVAIGG